MGDCDAARNESEEKRSGEETEGAAGAMTGATSADHHDKDGVGDDVGDEEKIMKMNDDANANPPISAASPLNEHDKNESNNESQLVATDSGGTDVHVHADVDVDDENKENASIPIEIPTVPPKKPRTAYFIFMTEKRQEVVAQQQQSGDSNKKQSIGDVAKIIGAMWKELDAETKDRYQDLARAEREKYREQMELYKLHHPDDDNQDNNNNGGGGGDNSNTNDPSVMIFPVARIRKICRLDPDVKNLSKEAVMLVTKCSELFTSKLAHETYSMAQMQKRRKLIPRDVHDVTSMKEPFFFLKDDIGDLIVQQQKEEQKRNGGSGSGSGKGNGMGKKKISDKMIAASANTKKLTSFFAKKK